MARQIRQFILYEPILTEDNAVRLPALTPTYGIFYFEAKSGVLQRIVTFDLDNVLIDLDFAKVKNVTEDIPFVDMEEIEKEIDRLRKIEFVLPKISSSQHSHFSGYFANQAILLTQLRTLAQFRITMKKFEEGV